MMWSAQLMATLQSLLLIISTTSVHCRVPLVEGDIVYYRQVRTQLSVPGGADTWTNRKIPYVLQVNKDKEAIVRRAMDMIEWKVSYCLQFIKISSHDTNRIVDFVQITDSNGCYSAVGRRGGMQILNLGPECYTEGIIMHELLHTLGFWHEQNRSDRDKYVTINYNNILPGRDVDFKKREDDKALVDNVKYDYLSIMHYKLNEFAEDRDKNTVTVIADGVDTANIGQREYLTPLDIKRIKWLYNCDTNVECQPPSLGNGSHTPIKAKYVVGDMVSFKCNSNFIMLPTSGATSMCKLNQQWAGTLPYCISALLPRNDYFYDNFQRISKMWTIDTAVTFRHSGPHHSDDTGPHFDHTFENSTGFYLYMQAGWMRNGQSTNIVVDPGKCSNGDRCCLMFYYSMYGSDMGTLEIKKILLNGRDFSASTIQPERQDTKEWVPFLVKDINVLEYNGHMHLFEDYKVKFIATRGSGSNSDIAIDDVFLGPCNIIQTYHDHVKKYYATGIDSKEPSFGFK